MEKFEGEKGGADYSCQSRKFVHEGKPTFHPTPFRPTGFGPKLFVQS